MRTLVTFFSKSFNSTEPKDYFLNPHCFGDDVCHWMITEMQANGVDVDEEPQQEDFGWYFCFRLPVGRYCFVVSCRPADDGEESLWIGWIERHCGLIGSLLGKRHKNISPHAVETVHRVIGRSKRVTGTLWHDHDKFRQGFEQSGAERPDD